MWGWCTKLLLIQWTIQYEAMTLFPNLWALSPAFHLPLWVMPEKMIFKSVPCRWRRRRASIITVTGSWLSPNIQCNAVIVSDVVLVPSSQEVLVVLKEREINSNKCRPLQNLSESTVLSVHSQLFSHSVYSIWCNNTAPHSSFRITIIQRCYTWKNILFSNLVDLKADNIT